MEQHYLLAYALIHVGGEEPDLLFREPLDIALVADLVCGALPAEQLHRHHSDRSIVFRLLKLERLRYSVGIVLMLASPLRVNVHHGLSLGV